MHLVMTLNLRGILVQRMRGNTQYCGAQVFSGDGSAALAERIGFGKLQYVMHSSRKEIVAI